MKILHLVLLSATVLTTSSLYAQNEKTAPAYGDNPNLFAVLAHKTGVAVQNTVEKVGSVTERGIEKVKPKVEEAWENTRDYSKEQADLALHNTRQGINTAVQKVNDTKDQLTGTSAGRIPITQGQLSQSSTAQVAPAQTTAPQYMPVQNNEAVITPALQIQQPAIEKAQNSDTITVTSMPVIAPQPTQPQVIAPQDPQPQNTQSQNTQSQNTQSQKTPSAPTPKTPYHFDLDAEVKKELSTP